MHKLAALVALALSVPILFAACVGDVRDTEEEAVGDVAEPGIFYGRGAPPLDPVTASHRWLAEHRGPCAEACFDLSIDLCDWQEACADDYGSNDMSVSCVDTTLTCDAAQHARIGGAWGLEYCWRTCMGIK